MARKPKTSRPDPAAAEAPWPREFVVTDKAGPKINGRRVQAGATITLGEIEAAHEIRTGAIVPATAPETPAAAPETPETE